MRRRGKIRAGDTWYEWFVVDDLGGIPAAAFEDETIIVPNRGSDERNLEFARAVAISLHLWKMSRAYMFPLD